MGELRMPSLGADMEQGTVVEWLVKPGDEVRRGDVVLVIETEKATMDVEVFEDGTISELHVAPGDVVPVGGALATIATSGSSSPDSTFVRQPPADGSTATQELEDAHVSSNAPGPSDQTVWSAEVPAPHLIRSPMLRQLAGRLDVDVEEVHGSGAHGEVTRTDIERAGRREGEHRILATPLARRVAEARGVDLQGIKGSGARGEVYEADVPARQPRPSEAALTTRSPSNGDGVVRRPQRQGQDRDASRQAAVAQLMARSKREIPHFYLQHSIDFAASGAWLAAANDQRSVAHRLLPAALLIRATAIACHRHPGLNGYWTDERFHAADQVCIGVAIHLRGGGLIAPAIPDAGALGVDDTMQALRALVERARSGNLRASDAIAPTITVTDVGDSGVDQIFGVIYPPQVAVVGFGAITDRPWASDGMLGIRPVVNVTLAADHRAVNGHEGARFLRTIDEVLQHPAQL